MSAMEFLDRQAELSRLTRLTRSREGGLAVITGRRRVGKTRLLVEWMRASDGVYWVADESGGPILRRNLAQTLATRLAGFDEVEYRDWTSLFNRLAREAKAAGWRGPLVLDEIPYVVASSSEVASALQNFVDHGARDARFTLAIAGSSQRMMQGLALSADAPVYGRAREIMHMGPIPPGYIVDAVAAGDPVRGAEAWTAFGGIPRYWELAEGFDSVRSAVDALALDPLGVLHDEPSHLLLEEQPPATALRPLLDAIGAGAHRVSEIAGRIGQPATSLARPLTRLVDLGLVHRETPFGESARTSKRALYKLADPFGRLWFSLVAPKRSQLVHATPRERLQIFDHAWPRLRAIGWEDLCRLAAPRLAGANGDVSFGPAGRFWEGRGPEWDIVAEATAGDHMFIGEAKWIERTPSVAELERLARAVITRGLPPVRRKPGTTCQWALFVPKLPARRAKSLVAGVHLFDAEDVLTALV